MASLQDKINLDIENIDRVFAELPQHEVLHRLSMLELAGVVTLLHNFYNGIENILKRILIMPVASEPHSSYILFQSRRCFSFFGRDVT